MFSYIFETFTNRLEILTKCEFIKRNATMHFRRTNRCDKHHSIWMFSKNRNFNIEELLCTKVSPESRFGHYIVCKRQCHSRRHDTITAVRDISKWSSMNNGWCFFQCLHKVRLHRLFKQRSNCTFRT